MSVMYEKVDDYSIRKVLTIYNETVYTVAYLKEQKARLQREIDSIDLILAEADKLNIMEK